MSKKWPDLPYKTVIDDLSSGKRVKIPIKTFDFLPGPPEGVSEKEAESILQPFYDRIAKIASHWGVFELSLDQTIWHLADIEPQKGACITAQFGSTYFRLKAVAALVEMLPNSERLLKKINQFSGEMEPVVRMRNRSVHDPIVYNGATKSVEAYRVTADKKLVYGLQKADWNEYDKAMRSIISLRKKFESLKSDIFEHASSSEKRS